MNEKKIRKLNHLSGEDYYYMTYLILLCLNSFAAKSSRVFKDHRKLTYLIQIISNRKTVDILDNYAETSIQNPLDKDLLYSSYSKGFIHSRDVYKLMSTLELKGYLEIIKTTNPEVLDIKVINKNIPKGFFDQNIFREELSNIEKVKVLNKSIPRIGFNTFIEKMYIEKGLRIWLS
jgi:hypothetical protein